MSNEERVMGNGLAHSLRTRWTRRITAKELA